MGIVYDTIKKRKEQLYKNKVKHNNDSLKQIEELKQNMVKL